MILLCDGEGLERQVRLDRVEIQRGVKQSLPQYGMALYLTILLNFVACVAAYLHFQHSGPAPVVQPGIRG